MLLASIPVDSPLEVTAAALRTKDIEDLTWEYVSATLIDEVKARSMRTGDASGSGQSNTNPSGRRKKKGGRKNGNVSNTMTDFDDMGEAAKAFAAAWAAKSGDSSGGHGSDKRICSFCDKPGHTAEKCYFNPKNPSNKLSNKMLERLMISSDVTDGNDGSGGFQSEVRVPSILSSPSPSRVARSSSHASR